MSDLNDPPRLPSIRHERNTTLLFVVMTAVAAALSFHAELYIFGAFLLWSNGVMVASWFWMGTVDRTVDLVNELTEDLWNERNEHLAMYQSLNRRHW